MTWQWPPRPPAAAWWWWWWWPAASPWRGSSSPEPGTTTTRHGRLRICMILQRIMIKSSGLLLLGVLGPAAGAEQLIHPPGHRHPHLYQGEHQVRGYTAALSIGEDYFKDINFFQLFNSQQPSWSLKYCSILETNLFSLSTFCKHPAYKRHWCIMFLWQDYFRNIPNAMQILESLSTQSLADLFFCSLSPGSGLTNRGSQSGVMTTLGQNQNLISSYSSLTAQIGTSGGLARAGASGDQGSRDTSGSSRVEATFRGPADQAQVSCRSGSVAVFGLLFTSCDQFSP